MSRASLAQSRQYCTWLSTLSMYTNAGYGWNVPACDIRTCTQGGCKWLPDGIYLRTVTVWVTGSRIFLRSNKPREAATSFLSPVAKHPPNDFYVIPSRKQSPKRTEHEPQEQHHEKFENELAKFRPRNWIVEHEIDGRAHSVYDFEVQTWFRNADDKCHSHFLINTFFVWNLRRVLEFLLRRFVQGAADVTNERAESHHDASVDGLLLARAVVMIAISIFLASLCALTTELGSSKLGPSNRAQNQPLADIRAQAHSQTLMEEAAPGVQALTRTPAKGAIAPSQ
jgi:hypothetical protein